MLRNKLLFYFRYDKINGLLIWRNKPAFNKGFLVGQIAGRVNPKGYRGVRLENKLYSNYKLIWLIETGRNAEVIDHINGKRDDDRFINLREVTNRQNQQNRICHRNGKLVGASLNKKTNRWVARVHVKGKNFKLGWFDTEKEAHEAYVNFLKDVTHASF